ncbi:GNAT family N-acetyltransferase [Desulfovibrio sp.]|uniref:GNAT family N-acetyltransferase n=1 Tax=Desulfovibrio sp. TaxID=885 RepID=UPI0025C51C04|nr:GNAT family N-acetyltransferase [Desulfovibrio sp.]
MKSLQGYTIDLATAAHVPLLAAIEVAAAGIFPPGSIPDHIRSEFSPVDKLHEAVQSGLLWVALDQAGNPVGYAYVRLIDHAALLAQIDVHPDHMRKGIGAALIGRVAGRMRQRQVPAIYLTTFTHVPWNAPFYARLGFTALDDAGLPQFLKDILEEEKFCGLTDRIGMRLPLAGAA